MYKLFGKGVNIKYDSIRKLTTVSIPPQPAVIGGKVGINLTSSRVSLIFVSFQKFPTITAATQKLKLVGAAAAAN
jgi:hypothetical protein